MGRCENGVMPFRKMSTQQTVLMFNNPTLRKNVIAGYTGFDCINQHFGYPLYYIYTLTVKNRVPCIITLLGGVLNVVGMFVLVRYTNMGIYSIVITTTIITTITSMITNPPYIAHCLKLKWYTFYQAVRAGG